MRLLSISRILCYNAEGIDIVKQYIEIQRENRDRFTIKWNHQRKYRIAFAQIYIVLYGKCHCS